MFIIKDEAPEKAELNILTGSRTLIECVDEFIACLLNNNKRSSMPIELNAAISYHVLMNFMN